MNTSESMEEIAATIIDLESRALERWGKGDPAGFLEICAPEIVYFDPGLEMRIDGLEALTAYYKTFWGMVSFERFELINPLVQVCGEMAVLTFNYASYTDGQRFAWNCTEVYRRIEGKWLIIQTHWSYTKSVRA